MDERAPAQAARLQGHRQDRRRDNPAHARRESRSRLLRRRHLVPHLLAEQDVDTRPRRAAEALVPLRHAVQPPHSQRRDRHGLHEPQPGRPRRQGARVHRGPHAPSAQSHRRLLAGRERPRGARRLDAQRARLGLLPQPAHSPLRRQYARRRRHRGRQGRGPDKARLAGRLLARRPPGRDHGRRHRRGDRRADGAVPRAL